jgi:hypothetical protein
MNVYLSFDIEVWCNGWDRLDANFPSSFERYVYGRSRHGEFALPQTLQILTAHGLRGVFFVEPLFATRFGIEPLREIVSLIQGAGHEVQLHLHPEWTDEALQPLLPKVTGKRQHLIHYDLNEQRSLIAHGLRLLKSAGVERITAFRAGSFAANRNTYSALRDNGLFIDSSLNRCHEVSGRDLRSAEHLDGVSVIEGVTSLPVTVFEDGFGRLRPAQVGACGARELASALDSAERRGHEHFMIVSHNFEMLRSGRSEPDWVVVRRFRHLCAHLQRESARLPVRTLLAGLDNSGIRASAARPRPRARAAATAWRHAEQLRRRWASLA